MTWFAVLWISWACPGGWLGSKAIPAPVRPFVCAASPAFAVLDREERAVALVRAEGPGARLWRCRGFRCVETSLTWRTVLEVGR